MLIVFYENHIGWKAVTWFGKFLCMDNLLILLEIKMWGNSSVLKENSYCGKKLLQIEGEITQWLGEIPFKYHLTRNLSQRYHKPTIVKKIWHSSKMLISFGEKIPCSHAKVTSCGNRYQSKISISSVRCICEAVALRLLSSS